MKFSYYRLLLVYRNNPCKLDERVTGNRVQSNPPERQAILEGVSTQD